MRSPAIEDVFEIHELQVERYGGLQGVRDRGLVESAIAQPKATFSGEHLHGDLFEMSAAYLFHLVRKHGFLDGNKRTGLLAALVFLDINGIPLDQASPDLHDLMVLSTRRWTPRARAGRDPLTITLEAALAVGHAFAGINVAPTRVARGAVRAVLCQALQRTAHAADAVVASHTAMGIGAGQDAGLARRRRRAASSGLVGQRRAADLADGACIREARKALTAGPRARRACGRRHPCLAVETRATEVGEVALLAVGPGG
jgi:death-on-curing protein